MSAAPKILHPNVYGIDMPCRDELIAHSSSNAGLMKTDAEIAAQIGADRALFQDLGDLEEAVRDADAQGRLGGDFENSVFSGRYVTGGVDAGYLAALAARRNDAAKRKRAGAGAGSPGLVSAKIAKHAQALHMISQQASDALEMFNLRTVKEV